MRATCPACEQAGFIHALALSDTGAVFSWGAGGDGRLGHGHARHVSAPKRIAALKERRVRSIAAGCATPPYRATSPYRATPPCRATPPYRATPPCQVRVVPGTDVRWRGAAQGHPLLGLVITRPPLAVYSHHVRTAAACLRGLLVLTACLPRAYCVLTVCSPGPQLGSRGVRSARPRWQPQADFGESTARGGSPRRRPHRRHRRG